VQLDGSFHLLVRGSRGAARLLDEPGRRRDGADARAAGDEETIWAAADVLRRWIEAYGVPLALYTDWKNVYVREPTAEEQATGPCP
jgi:hypothetical protein